MPLLNRQISHLSLTLRDGLFPMQESCYVHKNWGIQKKQKQKKPQAAVYCGGTNKGVLVDVLGRSCRLTRSGS